MKKLAHLLLVLSLIGFSACGKKKNKTDENAVANQFCTNGYCYNNTNGYNGYNGSIANTQQLLNVLNGSNAGFRVQTNPTETHVFVSGTMEYNTSSWWIFDWNTADFNETNTYNVVSSNNGNVSGNPYGTTFQAIANNQKSAVSGSTGLMQVGSGVYKVLTSSGDVIYLDFNQTIGANPTQIETANGGLTFRSHSQVGF